MDIRRKRQRRENEGDEKDGAADKRRGGGGGFGGFGHANGRARAAGFMVIKSGITIAAKSVAESRKIDLRATARFLAGRTVLGRFVLP